MEKSDNPQSDIKFSVIIPAYNEEKRLSACLESLTKQQSMPGEEYEIILSDDGSTDNTSEIAQSFNVKYLYQQNRGPASARNRGVREASGEIILFTDADCVPDRHWIQEMVSPFQYKEVAGVKGAYKTHQEELAARFAQYEFEDRYDLLKKSDFIDMVDTYSAAFRKDIFLKMGGFDESFPSANGEDTEFSYRLAKSGYKLIFNPDAFVYHIHPNRLTKYLRIKFWRGYWRIVVYKRYPDKAVKDSYTPGIIKIQTLLMALSMLLLFFSLFSIYFIYPFMICWGIILLSAVPFSMKTFHKDKTVGLISPVIILFRSIAFAMGVIAGMVRN